MSPPASVTDPALPEDRQRSPRKRRRIPIACNPCRNRKSRCDGAMPTCAMCNETGNTCVYLRASAHQAVEGSQPYQELEKRLHALEDLISSSRASNALSSQEGACQGGLALSTPTNSPADASQQTANHTPEESRNLAAAVDPVDGMGAVLSGDEERSAFHGPSSNITFTRYITQMVAHAGNITDPWNSSKNHGRSSFGFVNVDHSLGGINNLPVSQDPHELGEVDDFAVPHEGHSDELVQNYFSSSGLLFPFIHQSSFLDNYTRMKNHGPKSMRRTWLGLFNMVLAVSTNTIVRDDSLSAVRAREAQRYYARAVSLCDRYELGGSSLELVQYLVSQTQYLQATHKSVQTSLTHCMAVNAAIRIGLHSRQASQAYLPFEREVRKRTWFMCIIFDRVLSMTLGQPPVVPNSLVVLDLPEPLDPKSLESRSEDGLSLGVFGATIKLYKILGKVIEKQYGQNIAFENTSNFLDAVSPIASIDNELREWEQDLPIELKTLSSTGVATMLSALNPNGPSVISKRFQVTLTLRSLNVRLLLHRPVLVKYIDTSHTLSFDTTQGTLLRGLGSHSIYVCFRSAIEIITIVTNLIQEGSAAKQFLNAWWFTLYYTFNAGLITFAVMMLCQDPRRLIPDAPSKKECKKGLEKAIKALALLDPGNKMIERCHDYLERLMVAATTLTMAEGPSELGGIESVNSLSNHLANDASECPFSQSLLNGYSTVEKNVGNIMTGDDLDFLDHYFAPPSGMSSALTSTEYAAGLEYYV